MKFQKSFNDLKNSSNKWFQLIGNKFEAAGFQELITVPCDFVNRDRTVLCYVDESISMSK